MAGNNTDRNYAMIKLIQIYTLEIFFDIKSRSLRRPRIFPLLDALFRSPPTVFLTDFFTLEY